MLCMCDSHCKVCLDACMSSTGRDQPNRKVSKKGVEYSGRATRVVHNKGGELEKCTVCVNPCECVFACSFPGI